jgi:hypothetical protein
VIRDGGDRSGGTIVIDEPVVRALVDRTSALIFRLFASPAEPSSPNPPNSLRDRRIGKENLTYRFIRSRMVPSLMATDRSQKFPLRRACLFDGATNLNACAVSCNITIVRRESPAPGSKVKCHLNGIRGERQAVRRHWRRAQAAASRVRHCDGDSEDAPIREQDVLCQDRLREDDVSFFHPSRTRVVFRHGSDKMESRGDPGAFTQESRLA